MLFLLARDKRLEETLALLPALQVSLEKRGLKSTARVERDSKLGQVARGLRRFGEDTLSSAPMAQGGQDFAFYPIRSQLPPQYQEALAAAEKEWVRHASADDMALSAFDHLTFGVPLGAYGFVATSLHGGWLLAQGEWEEGTREVAPALVVALVAGGKGLRSLSKKSLKARLAEHRQKLADYKGNPDAFDNQGILRNAPSLEVRQRTINGRIKHLEDEVRAFEKAIRDLGGEP